MAHFLVYIALQLTVLVCLAPLDVMAGDSPRIAELTITGKIDVDQRHVLSDQARTGVLQTVSEQDTR